MKNNSPKVSVIIPSYNAQEVLPEAIQSVLKQSYVDFECILIDDNSTDNTWSIAQKYAEQDTRVKPYKNKKNLGIGANRAKGIELARGEYICWLDADDIAMPDRLKRQVEYLDSHPEVGVVGGYMECFGEGVSTTIRKYAEKDSDLRKTIFRYNPVGQPASMVRAECYKNVGSFDQGLKVSEDLDMLFRIGMRYKFANVQDVVVRYRQNKNSLTGANLKAMELVAIKLRRKYSKYNAYHATLIDWLYNFAQWISIYTIPPRMKIALFNMMRNSKA